MYRDDNEANRHRLDVLDRTADGLRKENAAMRTQLTHQQGTGILAPSMVSAALYHGDLRQLPEETRGRLAFHTVERFPVWATGLLHFFTFGLFSLIHFSLIHDRLPKATHDDPSAGKAIGFQFIPFFNLYWIFFNTLRLSDRLDLQLRLRGLPKHAPRGLMIACCIFTIVPYISLLIGFPVMWTIGACRLQSTVNKVAALDPHSWQS